MKVANKKSDPNPIYTQVVKSKGFDPLKNRGPNTARQSIPAKLIKASKQKKG